MSVVAALPYYPLPAMTRPTQNGFVATVEALVKGLNESTLATDKVGELSPHPIPHHTITLPAPALGALAIDHHVTDPSRLTSRTPAAETVVAPSMLHIPSVMHSIRKDIAVSAQNCWNKPNGAFTGEAPRVRSSGRHTHTLHPGLPVRTIL